MNVAATLIAQVSLSHSLIELENKRISDLVILMAKTITEQYPLSKLVDNNIIYHKSVWGNDVKPSSTLSKHNLFAYSKLSPSTFRSGSDLNSLFETKVFNPSASYVLYVANDEQGLESPLDFWDEMLAIELKNGQ